MSHSPLPWKVDRSDGVTFIRDANNKATFANEDYYPWVETKDFDFIVQAVNHHAELVGLLREFKDFVRLVGEGKPVPLDWTQRRIDEALSRLDGKAEGK